MVRLVSELLPRIRSLVKFVRPFGRETFVAPFKLRSKKTSAARPGGRLKLENRFWERLRLSNRVRLAGNVLGLLSRLLSRLSETKLLANARPAMLEDEGSTHSPSWFVSRRSVAAAYVTRSG